MPCSATSILIRPRPPISVPQHPPPVIGVLSMSMSWLDGSLAFPLHMLDASDYPQPQLPQAVSCAPVYAPQLSSDNRVGEERTHWRRFAMDSEGPRFHSA